MTNLEVSCASTDSSVPNLHPKPRKLPFIRYFIDVTAVALLYIVCKIIVKSIGPVENGFYCNDRKIAFPFKPSTVTAWELYIYCAVINLVVILITELILLNLHPHDRYSIYEYHRNKVARYCIRLAIFFGYFASFIFIIDVITLYTKYPVGRLRPYFLAICQPQYDKKICNDPYGYVANYTCTGTDLNHIRQARLSFFSGHSSLAVGASTFAVLYLQHRLVGQIRSRVVIPVIQTVILGLSLFIAYSRIFDFKHHWTDVIVGVSVGFIVMTILCRFCAGFHFRSAREVEKEFLALDLERSENEDVANGNGQVKLEGITPNRSFQWAEAYS